MRAKQRWWTVGLVAFSLLATGLAFSLGRTTAVEDDLHAAAANRLDPESPEVQEARTSAHNLSLAFRAASEKVLPSVVTIETSPKVTAVEQRVPNRRSPHRGQIQPSQERNPFEGTPFEEFFKGSPFGERFEMPPNQPDPRGPRGGGKGSGVIIDAKGIILTNNHVVDGGGDVKVRLHDGREFTAVDVKTDPKTDLAVVRIEDADGLIAAELGDSDLVAIGDWVLALGQPFGLESTVTAGIISAMHRGLGIASRENFLQTDAAINPGNSGGPLVNLNGEIIGINTAISSRSGGNDGIGFAIPINLAKWVSGQLVSDGVVRRAYLGVGIQPVTQDLATQFGVQPREGVVVTQVYPDTPADKAGLKAGDVIVTFGGRPVNSPQELQIVVERSKLGKSYDVEIVREGKRKSLNFVPQQQPDDFGSRAPVAPGEQTQPESSRFGAWGLELGNLAPDVAESLGMKGVEGVVITNVHAGGPAAKAGLKEGLVIRRIGQKDVHNVEEARQALESLKDASRVLLLVQSASGTRFVVVQS